MMAHIDLHITADSPAELVFALGEFAARFAGEAQTFPAASPTADHTSGSEGRPAPRKPRKPAAETGESMEGGKGGSGEPEAAAEETDTTVEEPVEQATEPAAASDAPTEASVTYDDVRNAVTGLAAAKGRDAAIAVLTEFGVDHASKLTEEQWPEAVAALNDAREQA